MARLGEVLGAVLAAAVLGGCGVADENGDELGTLEDEANEKGFDRHMVLLDEELTDSVAMDAVEIQAFLEHTPYGVRAALADYAINGRTAAMAIRDAAVGNGINPLVLLTRMQLEQSLVSATTLNKSKLDWAMGCGCPDDAACYSAYRGFDKQINCAAEKLRSYLDSIETNGETIAGWQIGASNKTLDGYWIKPRNAATAAIYTYTPWVKAAKNHHAIWTKYRAFMAYVAPAPGGCSAAVFPSGATLQLRPNAELAAQYGASSANCFLDTGLLYDPVKQQSLDVTTAVAEHFRLSEIVAASSSQVIKLDPALVEALEATRVTLGAPVKVSSAYRTPAELPGECASVCGPDGCSLDICEHAHGRGVVVESSAGANALLAAAASAGVRSCWSDGPRVYLGMGLAHGCPR